MLSTADERNEHAQSRSHEDDEDGADVQAHVVVGDFGGVAGGELFGGAVAVVVTDYQAKLSSCLEESAGAPTMDNASVIPFRGLFAIAMPVIAVCSKGWRSAMHSYASGVQNRTYANNIRYFPSGSERYCR